jgi:hypothetical protein
MAILKKIENNQLYLYMNGHLIYKRWLDTGESKVFDIMAYDKYTLTSIRDLEYEKPNELIHVKAKLKMKTTAEGGRTTGFINGYRPNHVFEHSGKGKRLNSFIGDIVFEGQHTIEPGEEKIVTVRFLLCMPLEQYMNVGRKWWIQEGERVLGEAEIISFE